MTVSVTKILRSHLRLLNIKNGKGPRTRGTKIFHETRAEPGWDSVFDLSLRLGAALRTDCELWRRTRWAFSIKPPKPRMRENWGRRATTPARCNTFFDHYPSRNSKFRRVSAEVRFARNFENWCAEKRREREFPDSLSGKSFWHSAIGNAGKSWTLRQF